MLVLLPLLAVAIPLAAGAGIPEERVVALQPEVGPTLYTELPYDAGSTYCGEVDERGLPPFVGRIPESSNGGPLAEDQIDEAFAGVVDVKLRSQLAYDPESKVLMPVMEAVERAADAGISRLGPGSHIRSSALYVGSTGELFLLDHVSDKSGALFLGVEYDAGPMWATPEVLYNVCNSSPDELTAWLSVTAIELDQRSRKLARAIDSLGAQVSAQTVRRLLRSPAPGSPLTLLKELVPNDRASELYSEMRLIGLIQSYLQYAHARATSDATMVSAEAVLSQRGSPYVSYVVEPTPWNASASAGQPAAGGTAEYVRHQSPAAFARAAGAFALSIESRYHAQSSP